MTTVNKNIDPFESISGLLSGDVATSTKQIAKGLVPLEKAPNALAFITSPNFLDVPELFPWQYDVTRDFFELLCPHCNDVDRIRTKDDVPVNDQILFEYNVCPQCGLDKFSVADQLHHYNELIGVLGMRSGKGVAIGCISAAILHELLCVEDLPSALGLVKKQMLEGAFVAASGAQAAETVYGHFRSFYDNSSWFQDLRRRLRDLEISDPTFRRGDLYRESDSRLYFRYKKINIEAFHSNSATLAGRTRVFAVIDELSRFDSGASKQSATEVYRVLKHSLLNVKVAAEKLRKKGIYDVPDAKMFCISSPIFDEDKTMQLLRQSSNMEKMFAYRRATWEANPNIEQEDLADEFMADPIGAQRDYGAQPPGAENPLIQDPRIVDVCIDKNRPSILTFREKKFDLEVEGIVFNYIKVEVIDVKYRNLFDYVIHIDPGRNKDSFCMGIAHEEDGVTVIDGGIEVRPVPRGNRARETPRLVYFPSMTDILIGLNKKMSIRAVSYDRWNSLEQIDRLRQNRILAIGENIDREDYMLFVESMRAKKVSFPRKEHHTMDPRLERGMPVAKALVELKSLEDNGAKVDHPKGGSSDMIQAFVGCHRLLMNPDKVLNQKKIIEDRRKDRGGRRFNRQFAKFVRLKRYV